MRGNPKTGRNDVRADDEMGQDGHGREGKIRAETEDPDPKSDPMPRYKWF